MLPIHDTTTEIAVFQTDGADADAAEINEPLFRAVDPDHVIPAADESGSDTSANIESISFNERLAKRKDDGKITLYNHDGRYTDMITSGDRLEIRVDLAIPEVDTWGAGSWGDDSWAGQRIVWTCWVRDRDIQRLSADRRMLNLDCEDFVYGIVGERFADISFENEQIPGALSRLLQRNAPETRLSIDNSISDELNATFAGTPLLDAFNHALGQGNMLASAYGDMITVHDIGTNPSQFTLTDDDVGLVEIDEPDGTVVNDVRVEGGTAKELDHEWTGRTGWETIDQNTIMRYWMPIRKSQVDSMEFYTQRLSEDNLTVRINHVPESQRESNEPLPRQSRQSDLARRTLSGEFISKDDWTEFQMPEHDLHTSRPLVIIECNGEDGHRIGTRTGGKGGTVPVYKAYYPYNIISREQSPASISNYRRREDRIVDDSITTFDEARAVAREKLFHNENHEKTVHTEARSLRAQTVRPGEVVTLDMPTDNAVGDFVVTEISHSMSDFRLTTELTMQESRTI